MSMASALALRGAPQQAFEAIELALQDLHGLSAARARVQRSAILQELGRLDAALDDLRLGLPGLRRAHDAQWEVRALSNRSLIWTARRSFAAAEADLIRAERLCDEHGLGLAGAYVEQNLGCLTRTEVTSRPRWPTSTRRRRSTTTWESGSARCSSTELACCCPCASSGRRARPPRLPRWPVGSSVVGSSFQRPSCSCRPRRCCRATPRLRWRLLAAPNDPSHGWAAPSGWPSLGGRICRRSSRGTSAGCHRHGHGGPPTSWPSPVGRCPRWRRASWPRVWRCDEGDPRRRSATWPLPVTVGAPDRPTCASGHGCPWHCCVGRRAGSTRP